jgi:hypothetical protein
MGDPLNCVVKTVRKSITKGRRQRPIVPVVVVLLEDDCCQTAVGLMEIGANRLNTYQLV